MANPLVHDTVVDASNAPVANARVTVQLVTTTAGAAVLAPGYLNSGQQTVLNLHEMRTNSSGYWEMTLVSNDLIEPSGNYYVVTEYPVAGGPGVPYTILVPNDTANHWVRDVLTSTLPTPLPLVLGGSGSGGAVGGVLTGTLPNPSFAQDMATQAELDAVAGAKIPLTQRGAANGVATLDGSGLVPDTQIPPGIARDSEVTSAVSAAVAALVAGAPGALDTLNELATAVNNDASFAATLTTALGLRLKNRGAWAATTVYAVNDLVTNNGGVYIAPTGFTSGSTFDATNWTQVVPPTGTYVPFLVSLDAADSTGAGNATALQAAITGAAAGTRIVPPAGAYPLRGVSIDGKTSLAIDNPACRLIRQSGSSLGGMITLGGTTANTDISINVELDGNSFVSGQAILCKQTTGLKIGSGFYAHHWRSHGIGFHTTASSKIDIADGARFEFIGIGATADPTGFDPAFPNGVAIYFAVTCPDVRIGNVFITDVKGQAAIYINGCNGMKIQSPVIKRTGYRGIMTTSATVKGLKIVEPTCEDIGILYEIKSAASGGHDPGDSLYGQGTNGIYISPGALNFPEDCQIIGGTFARCGENGIEGAGIWERPLVIDPGYAYTGFGSGLSRVGLFLNNGTTVRQPTILRPPAIGISMFESTKAITDVFIDRPYIEDPGTKAIHIQQSGSFTMSHVYVIGAQVKTKTTSPTHAVHIRGTSNGSLANTVLIAGTRATGTYSTAIVQTSASSPGTDASQKWDNALGGTVGTPLAINTQTGTAYTLVATDADSLVTLNNAAAITVTVPTNASVAFGNISISLAELGAGQVHVVGDTGVTVNGAPGTYLRAQYSQATLTKIGTDTWLLAGDLST